MNFKVLFRTLVVLLILFVMVYVGLNNTERIDFSFPLALQKSLRAPAALIYFGMFAVGFFGGAVLNAGGSGGSRRSSKEK
jgi:uncharacterized integral membrane protein